MRFKEVFAAFDDDGNGTLEPRELKKLVKRLLPQVTDQELRYFEVGKGGGGQEGCMHVQCQGAHVAEWVFMPCIWVRKGVVRGCLCVRDRG